jgi:hypothetical protein
VLFHPPRLIPGWGYFYLTCMTVFQVSYLLNLIDLMPTSTDLQAQSLIIGKSMPEQVKILKNFIYIIEVNKKLKNH